MAKRLTDTDLWKSQRWFRKLNPLDKLAFCYIKDQCNHAGVWKIDCSDLMEDLGLEEFNLVRFVKAVNVEFDKQTGAKIEKERVRIIDNSLWITGFIQFQYESKDGKVNQDAAPVRTAFLMLQGLDVLVEGIRKGYIVLSQPLNKGRLRAKDKDILIDKDIVVEKINIVSEQFLFEENEVVAKNKLVPDGFDTYPKKKNYKELPPDVLTTAYEYVYRLQRIKLPEEDIGGMWEIFKSQYLLGKKYYANDDEIYSHFLNWIKLQKFNDGNGKHKNGAHANGSGLSGTAIIEPGRKANTTL